MFRVRLNFKIYPFKSYSEALQFKIKNGGQICQLVESYGRRN